MDLATEPIVRETSLAAHGSLAPVAGGPARTAKAAPGTAAAIRPARNLRRLVAVPVVMGHSLESAKLVSVANISRTAIGDGRCRRNLPDTPAAIRHPAIPDLVIARQLRPL